MIILLFPSSTTRALPSKHSRTFTSLSHNAEHFQVQLTRPTFTCFLPPDVITDKSYPTSPLCLREPDKNNVVAAYESPQELQRRAKQRMTQCIQSTKTVDCYIVSSEHTRVPFSVSKKQKYARSDDKGKAAC